MSKVMPFNSWQEIQRGAERREGRGMAYGKWNDSSDQNKLFLVSLGPDPIIRLSVRSDNCWSRDSPDGRGKNDHLKRISTCLNGNAVLNLKFEMGLCEFVYLYCGKPVG